MPAVSSGCAAEEGYCCGYFKAISRKITPKGLRDEVKIRVKFAVNSRVKNSFL
jgi:hypothetical protein